MIQAEEDQSTALTIAIVGGGFTGAALAAQLLRRGDRWLRVIVVERDPTVGRGVAYGTQFNWHLLNVPAEGMSMFPDEPEHFLRWAQRNYDRMVEAGTFVPRRVYGQYVESTLREIHTAHAGRLHWLDDEALMIQPGRRGAEILLRSGERVIADKIVLALGNLPPGDPSIPGLTGSSQRYVSYPWAPTALEGVEHENEILLIGSGLTSVDMVMALRAREFRGTVHIVSRRGLLPQPHKSSPTWPLFWHEGSPRSARGLLRLVRDQVNVACQQGTDWRSVIDALRPVTARIWQSMPEAEQRRFLRHVRAYWEVRRHRLAPQVAKLLAHQIAERKVRVYAGRIVAYRENDEAVEIRYRRRTSGKIQHLQVSRVVNCTGPETDCRKIEDVLLADLRSQRFVRPDRLFLGLEVAANGAAIDRHGRPSAVLFVAGPARKGQLWETTAVPEIRVQVAELASELLNQAQSIRLMPPMDRGQRNVSMETQGV